jgi:hypothetical protein
LHYFRWHREIGTSRMKARRARRASPTCQARGSCTTLSLIPLFALM